MQNNISISLVAPHMTRERYSEVTGIDMKTIELMLSDGRLSGYRHRLKQDGKRELVLINIAALTVDALVNCQVVVSSEVKTTRRKTVKSS
ncbi:hypothetical protein ABEI05_12585 [Erwinia billingiae]|uniref:hypothetical protein n=1 Tax=Erwinia billingiae TaxID=182337 RepID=UPI0032082455